MSYRHFVGVMSSRVVRSVDVQIVEVESPGMRILASGGSESVGCRDESAYEGYPVECG